MCDESRACGRFLSTTILINRLTLYMWQFIISKKDVLYKLERKGIHL